MSNLYIIKKKYIQASNKSVFLSNNWIFSSKTPNLLFFKRRNYIILNFITPKKKKYI